MAERGPKVQARAQPKSLWSCRAVKCPNRGFSRWEICSRSAKSRRPRLPQAGPSGREDRIAELIADAAASGNPAGAPIQHGEGAPVVQGHQARAGRLIDRQLIKLHPQAGAK